MSEKLSLRDLRKRAQERAKEAENPYKLKIAEIAQKVGVHANTWYNWERSAFKDPGFKPGHRIMEALGCSAEELYEAIEPNETYQKEFEYNGEIYIRCTLLVQLAVFELIEAWVGYVEFIGTYTNKDIEPRRKGRAVELAIAHASASCDEFKQFFETGYIKDDTN